MSNQDMTIQEAIKIIKTEQECVKRNDGKNCDRDCKNCDLLLESNEILNGFEMAVALLEHRIPKRPYMVSDGDAPDGTEVWEEYCPYCGHDFDGDEPKYCPTCGCAIDWSDEDTKVEK